jgi:hypothetical protein
VRLKLMSALPLIADMPPGSRHVRFVPKGDIRPGRIVMHFWANPGCETL